MSLVDSIINYLKGKEAGEKIDAPEGVCPNCWGEQQYDGVIREMARDNQVNVNAGREKYAFIQDFVVNHVDGIKLKNTINGKKECARCISKAQA